MGIKKEGQERGASEVYDRMKGGGSTIGSNGIH